MNTVRPINRNTVYRVRRVKIEFPFFSPPRLTVFAPIELTEVSSVNFGSTAPTAVFTGPLRSIIQPWYFGPFSVEVNGKSYIGAYKDQSLNVSADNDIAKIKNLRNLVNQQFETTGFNKNVNIILTFDDPDNTDDLNATHQLVGSFNDVKFGEDEGVPYLAPYTLKFTMQEKAPTDISSGAQKAKKDSFGSKLAKIGNGVKNIFS